MTRPIDTMATWHHLVATRDATVLDDILADDVVFHSPVVHTPQVGKALTQLYLEAVLQVLGGAGFRYVREVVGPHDAALEFEAELQGIYINGVDLIRWNEQGQIDDFKVMLRPLKAVNLIHQLMGAFLQQSGQGGG